MKDCHPYGPPTIDRITNLERHIRDLEAYIDRTREDMRLMEDRLICLINKKQDQTHPTLLVDHIQQELIGKTLSQQEAESLIQIIRARTR